MFTSTHIVCGLKKIEGGKNRLSCTKVNAKSFHCN